MILYAHLAAKLLEQREGFEIPTRPPYVGCGAKVSVH